MRVLSIVHEPGETGGGGTFEERATALGHDHVRWLPPDGGPPGPPEEFDAVMVFGGSVHPDEDERHPWLPGEADYIRATLAARVPLLGVCLGSQLLSRAADGGAHPAAEAEIGWCPVTLTDDGADDPVLGVLPRRLLAFQWHHYAWRLPPGGVLLAESPAAPQAFRLSDRFWGVQFHPEVNRAMLDDWTVGGADELPLPADEITRQTDANLPTWSAQGAALCESFLARAARVPR